MFQPANCSIMKFSESSVGSCSVTFLCDACSIAQALSAALLRNCECCHGFFLCVLWACVRERQRASGLQVGGTVNGWPAAMLALP